MRSKPRIAWEEWSRDDALTVSKASFNFHPETGVELGLVLTAYDHPGWYVGAQPLRHE
jgi:hypothetical protein